MSERTVVVRSLGEELMVAVDLPSETADDAGFLGFRNRFACRCEIEPAYPEKRQRWERQWPCAGVGRRARKGDRRVPVTGEPIGLDDVRWKRRDRRSVYANPGQISGLRA